MAHFSARLTPQERQRLLLVYQEASQPIIKAMGELVELWMQRRWVLEGAALTPRNVWASPTAETLYHDYEALLERLRLEIVGDFDGV